MINISDIKQLIEDGSNEFRLWLDGNPDAEFYDDLDYDQSRLATVSENNTIEAIEQMLKITIQQRTLEHLENNQLTPSLLKAYRLLEKRKIKNKF